MPSCSPLAPLTHHIRSLLAVFLLNFVFFPHGRRPYWRESLAFFPHKRSMGALGGQACLGWPRCLVCGLALLQSGKLEPQACKRLSEGRRHALGGRLRGGRRVGNPPPAVWEQNGPHHVSD